MRQAGRPVPPPAMDAIAAYSGKWVLRTPTSLHRKLTKRAREERVSLNALAVAMLAEGLGQRTGHDAYARAGIVTYVAAARGHGWVGTPRNVLRPSRRRPQAR